MFGVAASTPVPWWSLATGVRSRTRSGISVESQLHREINAYIDGGTRNVGRVGTDEPLSVWTMTRIGVRVTADESDLAAFATAEDVSWDAVLCDERTCVTE